MNLRSVCVIAATLGVAGTSGFNALPAAAANCSAVEITASSLNVRSSARTSGTNRVGVANRGERYVLTGAVSGSWKQIWFDRSARWIYARNYTNAISVECGTVAPYAVNIRRGPGTSYASVGTAPRSSRWALDGARQGAWVRIWWASESRWVSGNVLNGVDVTPPVQLTDLRINSGATSTSSRFATLDYGRQGSVAVSWRAAETQTALETTAWKPFSGTPAFTLSEGNGVKRVYMQLRDASGRYSNILFDEITLNVPPPVTIPRIDRAAFFNGVRSAYGSLRQSQVDGLLYILRNMETDTRSAWRNRNVWTRQMAYTLSTTKHEVANTWQPITEYSNTTCRRYDGGCRYKGRGYVQLTHQYNYIKLGDRLGVNLVDFPERALEPDIAWNVMSEGMFYGLFTGRALGNYVNDSKTDYVNARRVVNGLDKSDLLAGYARTFETILENSIR